LCFFFQAEDGIRGRNVTGVQTCALPISSPRRRVHGEGGDTVTQEPPSLFEPDSVGRPLADRLRPETLEDVLGQEHLLGHDAPIGRMVDERRLVSMVLWGPP